MGLGLGGHLDYNYTIPLSRIPTAPASLEAVLAEFSGGRQDKQQVLNWS